MHCTVLIIHAKIIIFVDLGTHEKFLMTKIFQIMVYPSKCHHVVITIGNHLSDTN